MIHDYRACVFATDFLVSQSDQATSRSRKTRKTTCCPFHDFITIISKAYVLRLINQSGIKSVFDYCKYTDSFASYIRLSDQ